MKESNPWWDPVDLINALTSRKMKPEDLVPRQRRLIVKYCMEHQQDWSNVEIGRLIGMRDSYVHHLKRKMLLACAHEIDSLDIKIIALSLKKKKEELQRRAWAKEDFNLIWKIECDFVKAMQDLGYVYKAPEKVNVSGRLEMDTETGIREYFKETGVSNVDDFIAMLARVRGNGGGNGNGNGRQIGEGTVAKGLLVAPGKQNVPAR